MAAKMTAMMTVEMGVMYT